jgi:hypothetical protein
MKRKFKGFENYPAWAVLVFNLVSWSVQAAGLYLTYLIWPPFALLFLVYIIYMELSVYREGCVSCYYYGKVCVAGRGKIAKLFFKGGDPRKFGEREINWKDLLPSFLGSIVTVVAGIYLLVFQQGFDWFILLVTAWPVIMFIGNQYTYGELACPNCRQAEICCPVSEFFRKKQQAKK